MSEDLCSVSPTKTMPDVFLFSKVCLELSIKTTNSKYYSKGLWLELRVGEYTYILEDKNV